MDPVNPTVSANWLSQNRDRRDLVVLDASIKKSVADSPPAILDTFIPDAFRFDFETSIRDLDSDLPHMLPSPKDFQAAVSRIGISNNQKIVVYCNRGMYASPRAWWMFKAMGHEDVSVLDGGLPEWIRLGLPTIDACLSTNPVPGNFVSNFQSARVCDLDELTNVIGDATTLILDARSSGRFQGTEPEPRPGLRSGHISGSVSLPFGQIMDGFLLKRSEEIHRLVVDLATRQPERIITSCGSGVTACILALAAELAGFKNIGVYDGSWAEFGRP